MNEIKDSFFEFPDSELVADGYKTFFSLCKNLKASFNEVYDMNEYQLDISYYEKKFNEIKCDFNLIESDLKKSSFLDEKFPNKQMSIDSENYSLSPINKALGELTREFSDNIKPLHNVYKLFTTIDDALVRVDLNCDNSDEIVKNTIELIKHIHSINTHNNVDITKLINKAYDTIYNVLLFESFYGKHTVLNYINKKNVDTDREFLGEKIRNCTKDLLQEGLINQADVNREFIEHISEGFEYDYLSADFVSKLSKIKYGPVLENYSHIKAEELENIQFNYQSFSDEGKKIVSDLSEVKGRIKKLYLNLAYLRVKACSLFLIPFIAAGVGGAVGAIESSKITEYSTTTRVINLEDNSEISRRTEFDEHPTSYVATILVCEPWKKDIKGGYIRTVTAYEFKLEESPNGYDVSLEYIQDNLREKYVYSEKKDNLSINDSVDDYAIYLTETYQDKTNSRKSTKYIVKFILIGGLGTSLAELLLCYFRIIRRKKYYREIEICKERMEEAQDKYKELLDDLSSLKMTEESIMQQVNSYEAKYGEKVKIMDLKRR